MNNYFRIVEKNNHLALHALCDTKTSAERWIAIDAKQAVENGYFMDKTLTQTSFEIIPPTWAVN